MKFSVLISIYHKENPKFLNECLESILVSQTLLPEEVILVKDGRLTEELEQEVSNWQRKSDNILKIIELDENVGLGRALNYGLKYCSNEWVFRMDTDDICLPNRFEKQVKFIQENPNVVLLSSQIEEFDEFMSKSLGIRRVPISCKEIYSSALLRTPFNHMAVAYKKSVIEQVGGYQHHLYMEDYNLWLRVIAKQYQVYNLPEVLVKVRSGVSMYARRKGLDYIKSEYQLAELKRKLKLQSTTVAAIYFSIRALPRLLPASLLGRVYKKLRKG